MGVSGVCLYTTICLKRIPFKRHIASIPPKPTGEALLNGYQPLNAEKLLNHQPYGFALGSWASGLLGTCELTRST